MKTKTNPAPIHSLALPKIVSLVPFATMPDPRLLAVLQPLTLGAILVMTLHIGLTPLYAERIVGTIDMSSRAVAFMGTTAERLVTSAVSLPLDATSALTAVAVNVAAPGLVFSVPESGIVAGISEVNHSAAGNIQTSVAADVSANSVDAVLIGIADASERAQRFLDRLNHSTMKVLVYNNTFDHWDNFVNQFRW